MLTLMKPYISPLKPSSFLPSDAIPVMWVIRAHGSHISLGFAKPSTWLQTLYAFKMSFCNEEAIVLIQMPGWFTNRANSRLQKFSLKAWQADRMGLWQHNGRDEVNEHTPKHGISVYFGQSWTPWRMFCSWTEYHPIIKLPRVCFS